MHKQPRNEMVKPIELHGEIIDCRVPIPQNFCVFGKIDKKKNKSERDVKKHFKSSTFLPKSSRRKRRRRGKTLKHTSSEMLIVWRLESVSVCESKSLVLTLTETMTVVESSL